MAISKRPMAAKEVAQEQFIKGAPDSSTANKGKIGRKTAISLTIKAELLDVLDKMASDHGQSRAALINRGILELVQRDGR